MKLDILYINLQSATGRNDELVRNFSESAFTDEWTLHRFEAISAQSQLVLDTKGTASPNLKGNYHSHVECIRQSKCYDNHVMIIEDDTKFCHATQFWLERIIESISENDWDIILIDFYVSNAIDMADLMKARRQCLESNSISLTNAALWNRAFAGAGSYIVNKNSKNKIIEAMSFDSLDYAYDLLLRQAMCGGVLNGILVFPFLTTVSDIGDDSQVQGQDRLLEVIYMHLFRRLTWIGADDLQAIKERADQLRPKNFPEDVALLESIMMPLLSLQMHWRT
ncbi:hypothetical protein [Magnetospirillum sp. 15-1]|uniref:hypothetical protein n=1 Tax=Magnetospirillum sp. 15-1 TaxID=1979370 RepID=UPI0011422725|nr:hypothetical protein [Magnetospirillum sp. 15-1]